MPLRHRERHRTARIGWLRAAVLGANDGLVSTASLVLGVAAAQAPHSHVVVAGVAGLVAGAMSMAAGEYVSVHSQTDTEQAELQRERTELTADAQGEHEELREIYIGRGLDPALATQVAAQLMAVVRKNSILVTSPCTVSSSSYATPLGAGSNTVLDNAFPISDNAQE